MSEEVWLTCATHALSTETEEIMGLLLGDIQVTITFFQSLSFLCFLNSVIPNLFHNESNLMVNECSIRKMEV